MKKSFGLSLLEKLLGGSFLLLAHAALANSAIPSCDFQGKNLPIDNSAVEKFEKETPNETKKQAHVQGVVSEIYADQNGHHHFGIQFQDATNLGIEVVYNEDFGDVPNIAVGMNVEACGEYITSNKPTSQYPASPMGAIIHWVHINPSHSPNAHASGFLVIDGVVCGQDTSHAGRGEHGDGNDF